MRLEPQQEEKLINQLKKGEAEAFNELYESYYRAVFGHIKGRVENEKDAEDICQETWIWLHEKIHDYDASKGRFYTFIVNHAKLLILRYSHAHNKKLLSEMLLNELSAQGIEIFEEIINAQRASDSEVYSPEQSLIFQENESEKIELYNIIIETAFREGGPPHQLVVFGFSELIFPLEEEQVMRISGCPTRVVDELSGALLSLLGSELEKRYAGYSGLPKPEIARYFCPLREKMEERVKDVITDSKLREKLKDNLDKKSGDTILEIYYGKDPVASVSDWSYKVKKRVFKYILKNHPEIKSGLRENYL